MSRSCPARGSSSCRTLRHSLLRGRLYELVVPWLDGRTADDVCGRGSGRGSPAEVYYALTHLERKGYLCEEEPALPTAQAALWSSQQVAPGVAVAAAGGAPGRRRGLRGRGRALPRVTGVPPRPPGRRGAAGRGADRQRAAWRAAGLERGSPAGRAALAAGQAGRPAGLGRSPVPPRDDGLLGVPGPAASGQLPGRAYLQGRNGHAGAVVAGPRGHAGDLAGRLGPGRQRRRLVGRPGRAARSWRASSRPSTCPPGAANAHPGSAAVLPGVRRAGLVAAAAFGRRSLETARRRSPATAGHRVVPPEETLARYGHHVSPITGAVSMLERAAPDGDGVLHVYVAGSNLARPAPDARPAPRRPASDERRQGHRATCRPGPARCARDWSATPASSGATSRAAAARLRRAGRRRRPPSTTACSSATRQYRDREALNAAPVASTSSRCRSTRRRRSSGRPPGR